MLKRKRGGFGDSEDGNDDTTIYTTPNLESTVMLETGKETNDCIGKISSIPINASASSGAKLFQYNRFFWNKDLFTFNYANCAVFVAIAYLPGFDGSRELSPTGFLFYPIFLPRSTMSTYQSILNNVTLDPAKRKYLIDDVLYYLNGAFTSFNFDLAVPITAPPPGITYPTSAPLSTGPSLYSIWLKGYLQRPTANNPRFPIFQDGKEPPLKWIYLSSNNQIALVRNPVFWDNPENYTQGASIAFQLVSPEVDFIIGANNVKSELSDHNGPPMRVPIPPPLVDVYVPSVFNGFDSSIERGWCTQGVYGLGFAQGRNPSNPNLFSDVYGTKQNRNALWANTVFPPEENYFINFRETDRFEMWAAANKLELYYVVAKKVCSLLPSRMIICKSDILTRTQKVMVLSNNPEIASPSTLNVVYLDLDTSKTKLDFTSPYSTPPLTTSPQYSPVVHFNPSNSILSIDLQVKDEWGNFIQNYRSPSGFNLDYSSSYVFPNVFGIGTGNFISLLDGDFAFQNAVFQIPPWLAALNPNTSSGNTEPLLAPFSTYLSQSFYGLFKRNISRSLQPPQNGETMVLPPDFTPSMPYSGNIIHFGRVLGS